ncbi:Anthocyanin 5-aromatic acyltransferase [Sesamum alatum]|uniref:Anthocyanin 5-aromatic acyltransferase n=1 Tax=Sesamum alatum TaxID=300844 RepID=A0AAE1XVI6_9LAMI|nr:Anthocyanin 5-aromatic acyltransferase [Sesamum alatum]
MTSRCSGIRALAAEPGLIHLSSFTITTAYVWSCFAKSAAESGEEVDDNEPEYFAFAVDARHRLEPPVPATYFGNCLAFIVTESRHGLLRGSDGFVAAVKSIGEPIANKANNKEEILRDVEDWVVKFGPLVAKRFFGVAGSPKFDLYDTDFGWGRPKKYESVSIDRDGSISLCKSREFEGGLEIGLSFPRKKMDAFAAVFADGLTKTDKNSGPTNCW